MNAVPLSRICPWLVLLALAGACTSIPRPGGPSAPRLETGTQPPKPAQLNLSGFPPAFREGYADGCESGRAGGRRRDERRYKAETSYMMGWNDGYSICARR